MVKQSSSLIVALVVGLFVAIIAVPLFGSYFAPTDAPAAGVDTPAPSDSTPEPSPIPNGPDSTPTPTAVRTAEPTATPTPTATTARGLTPTVTSAPTPTTSPEMSLNATELAAAVTEEVNAQRQEQGLDGLTTDGATAEILTEMATTHSRNIRTLGYASHYYQSNNSADRYRVRDIYSRCQFASDGAGHLVTADRNSLEVIGKIDAEEYTASHDDPEAVYDAVARTLVSRWFGGDRQAEKVSYENAQRLGAGVALSDAGGIYVTVNFC